MSVSQLKSSCYQPEQLYLFDQMTKWWAHCRTLPLTHLFLNAHAWMPMISARNARRGRVTLLSQCASALQCNHIDQSSSVIRLVLSRRSTSLWSTPLTDHELRDQCLSNWPGGMHMSFGRAFDTVIGQLSRLEYTVAILNASGFHQFCG